LQEAAANILEFQKVVKGGNMSEIPSTRENLSKLFYYTCNLYDRKHYPDIEAVYQFVLEEEEETYCFYVSVSRGKSEFAEGRHVSPSLTI
jgi:hypothetical protein